MIDSMARSVSVGSQCHNGCLPLVPTMWYVYALKLSTDDWRCLVHAVAVPVVRGYK